MIIKNVPFISDMDEEYGACQGPPTAMMALRFFRPDVGISFKELYERMGYERGKWFFESYIVELLASYGIRCVYCSDEEPKPIGNDPQRFRAVANLELNEKNKKLVGVGHHDRSLNFVLNSGFFRKEKIDTGFITGQIRKGRLVIAVIDRNKLSGKGGFRGHFILVRGFDDENLICNDAYLGENLRIRFDNFSNAFYAIDWSKAGDNKTRHAVVVG